MLWWCILELPSFNVNVSLIATTVARVCSLFEGAGLPRRDGGFCTYLGKEGLPAYFVAGWIVFAISHSLLGSIFHAQPNPY